MLDKLLGRKEKGINIFNLPERKYCHEHKKLSKMDKKDLLDVVKDMEKHIQVLVEKLENGKKEYQQAIEKSDELAEKLSIVNGEISRITNEHEQLNIKFLNLQESIEYISKEKQDTLKAQIQFIQIHSLTRQKIRDFEKVLSIYRDQVTLCEKITQQNKQLKTKHSELENQYFTLSEKFNQRSVKVEQRGGTETTTEDRQDEPEEKDIQILKGVVEGKEQIILSLGKQITSEKEKNQQNIERIKELENLLSKQENITHELIEKEQEHRNNKSKLEASLEESQNKIRERQKQIEKLSNQLQEASRNNQFTSSESTQFKQECEKLQEQKSIQQKTNQQHLQSLQESFNKIINENEELKGEIQRKNIEIQNIKMKTETYQKEMTNLYKLSGELKGKEKEIEKLNSTIKQKNSQISGLRNKINQIEEDSQIKQKRHQSELNQERIKSESMQRNITNLSHKDEQNNNKLNEMYQKKIMQDGRMAQMEKKLKQYKHLIQYLKKEKIQLQRTFENKIKGFEEMVAGGEEEEEETPRNQGKQIVETEEKESYDYQAQLGILSNKMIELQEQVYVLREENENLEEKNKELSDINSTLELKVRTLNEKKEEVMKQLKKIERMEPKKQERIEVKEGKGREKKIADKAYRGFDKLTKFHQQLYKAFVTVMSDRIEQKPVQQMEALLNTLLKQTIDMRDILADYL